MPCGPAWKTKPVRRPAKVSAGWKSGRTSATCSRMSGPLFFFGASVGWISAGLVAGDSTELSTEIIGLVAGAADVAAASSLAVPPPKSSDEDVVCGAGSGAPPTSVMSGLEVARGATLSPNALAIDEPVPDIAAAAEVAVEVGGRLRDVWCFEVDVIAVVNLFYSRRFMRRLNPLGWNN